MTAGESQSAWSGVRYAVIGTLAFWALAVALETIPADSIRPGMKGYGLSVFSGQKTERFQVEVIDVMHKVTPKGDLILCRLTGADLENTGVIAGMSGSPVYLEGKLAGAVAYAWGFSKEAIAGVTPIREMLELWQADQGRGSPRLHLEEKHRFGFSPLPVPVALSGYTPRLAELVDPCLDEFGLMPVAASGKTSTQTARADLDSVLVPGGAVGVVLTDGDVRMSAIGTLTHREGNRIVAFGHPMFLAGAIEMPFCAGVIHTVMPSLAVSFKLFSAAEPVGTITQDRMPGIAGVIGPVPEMVPVEVTLQSKSAQQNYRFRTMKHPVLASLLISIGLVNIVYSSEGALEELTLSSRMSVTIDDTVQFTVEHLFAGEDPGADLYHTTTAELRALLENRFRTPELTRVSFELNFTPGRNITRIASARLDRRVAKPGDTITVFLDLRDRQDNPAKQVLKVALPLTTPAGKLTLVIASRDSLQYRETMRAPGKAEPNSLAGILHFLESSGKENELVVAGFIPLAGITVGDKEFPAPPPSVRSVIMASAETGPVLATTESRLFEQSFLLDEVISGVYELTLEVRR